MKELERSEFDEQWKGALKEAEVSPAPSVWSNLDRELTLAEGNEIKKRMIFYQRLAAASVLFALMAGSFGVYHWRQNDNQMALLNSNSKSTIETKNSQLPDENTIAVNGKPEVTNEGSTSESKISGTLKENGQERTKENFQGIEKYNNNSFLVKNQLVAPDENRDKINSSVNEKENRDGNSWYAANINVDLPLLPTDSVRGEPTIINLVRKLPAISPAFMAESKKNNFSHEKVWASVIAAAGTYADNKSGSSFSMASAQSTSSSSLATGNSYTFGMLGGVRVAKRWVLQSGVQYMNQSAGYSSNISSGSLDVVSSYANKPSAFTGPVSSGSMYDITSTNQFLTIPVQAGYLLIDKKLGWQINPGVATDFFVRNTLTDPSGQRQSYSQGAGSDSPYRSINFAGLMSSEVSYRLGKSYRVSLVPGFRYSLSPILKSQNAGNPFVWDVGFRFRYIFK